jgi:hypothetical protein
MEKELEALLLTAVETDIPTVRAHVSLRIASIFMKHFKLLGKNGLAPADLRTNLSQTVYVPSGAVGCKPG